MRRFLTVRLLASSRAGLTLLGGLAVLFILSPMMLPRALGRTSVDAVAEGLTCQCGCGLTVANCNHPQCEFSVPVRAQIEAMLAKGMTGREVLASFRTKYGEKILSAPTTEGFNLLAWIMPFTAIVVGGGFMLVVFGRWRAGSKPVCAPVTEDTRYDSALRERLESALEEDR